MIRGFIAMTLDGMIAGPDHSLAFLDPYEVETTGYAEFIKDIRTVVMGRATYEVCLKLGPWAYAEQKCIVVTSAPIEVTTPATTLWHAGVDALIDHLHRTAEQDVWVVGGGRLQQAFLDRDAVDLLDLFILPVILGAGIPMIPPGARPQTLALDRVDRHGEIARLVYRRP